MGWKLVWCGWGAFADDQIEMVEKDLAQEEA